MNDLISSIKGLKTEIDDKQIIVRKNGNHIFVSRGGYNSTLKIETNTIYTIEVITGGSRTDLKIKHDGTEIKMERNRPLSDWNGEWGGDLVAIEYPNKDLWSEHPVLNELKLTSLVPMTGGSVESEESADSNDENSAEEKMENRKGNYLVFPNTE